ncbi:hypothetical protein BEP19_15590 [Ammoniphilus oxalaticus]|uniref:CheW-like domain-containing protein n=1 Tax=Ammoniphilus oxalaticus TaxID=66863 RepID=A0A419SDC3_9BACL|nr:chemotaxis protein CheW [Ammoniphilus oxalaticus]RKD21098.1 hypothetical protein BEP19_15590 [Ammoniphilus oxalaticus]
MEQTQSVELDQELLKIVTFQVNDEEYGTNISLVNSIEKIMEITRVPNVSEYIVGVMNLRGNVIPIVDLRKRFGLPAKEFDDETRIIVLQLKEIEVGIVVDSCSSVVDINKGDIEPPPTVSGDVDTSFILGAVKIDRRLIILLDMEETIKNV